MGSFWIWASVSERDSTYDALARVSTTEDIGTDAVGTHISLLAPRYPPNPMDKAPAMSSAKPP